MLVVKNLRKQYKPKKGAVVNALDGVDLEFPQKGMIFVLGKSGSGKSTLLNLLGGLDTYDDGEIIIKGKSSKDFSQSEFDSYRNTYLGFIFQSYNILDEFSVAENISLAVELQHGKCTKEQLDDILEQVDLTGFAKRNPRELSGGQKQRVAIARALVKNPEIILADEPTGALDSNTGIAVFDTLKKLSKDKLVIIVSHDREFAENYGDRVIEFKDGKIISDIIKYPVENVEINKNIALYENQAIKIKRGYQLTPRDLEQINKHISNTNGDVYISLNERTSIAAKTAARITDNGASEAFRDTKPKDIIVNKDDTFKLKKSRLGFKHSFRIGASSLKVKPVRLLITIILAISAFTLFGVADTMGAYDGANVTYNSFIDNNVTYSGIQKYQVLEHYNRGIDITQSDLDYIAETFDSVAIPTYSESFYFGSYLGTNLSAPYYKSGTNNAICFTEDNIKSLGLTLTGNLPSSTSEIVITEYIYQHFVAGGHKFYNYENSEYETTKILSHSDLIGKQVGNYTIVGILDTELDEKYDTYKDVDTPQDMSTYTFQSMVDQELHNTVIHHVDKFVKENSIETLQANGTVLIKKNETSTAEVWFDYMQKYSSQNVLFFNNHTSLNDNQVIISYDSFNNNFNEEIYEIQSNITHEQNIAEIKSYVENNGYPKLWEEEFYKNYGYPSGITSDEIPSLNQEWLNYTNKESWYEETWIYQLSQYFYNDVEEVYDYPSGRAITFNLVIKELDLSLSGNLEMWNYDAQATVEVVGVSFDIDYSSMIISNNLYSEFEKIVPAKGFSSALIIFPEDKATLRKLVDYTYEKSNYTFDFTCSIQSTISYANEFIEMFAKVFLYLGLFFALFASLLLFNFISISISYKQKEIGILRAIGARSKDVFGIFFSETLIIGAINFVFACVATFVVSSVVNTMLKEQAGIAMSLLNPNIRQIALIFGVSLLVSFISSFFPVYKIAIKRPIESIRQG